MMSDLIGLWMDPDAVYLSPAPLYHTAPSVWSMSVQAAGITTVVMEKFDAEGALDAIQRDRVTHGQFVPAMFIRMLKLPDAVRDSYDLSSLKRVMHAVAPCPVEIKKRMIDWWSTLVTSEDWQQRVMAIVETVEQADATEQFADELLDWLRDRLSHFKCPRSIAFEKQLPRTDSGKLYKNGLIEKYSA